MTTNDGYLCADDSRLGPSSTLSDLVDQLAALELDPEQIPTRDTMLAFAAEHADALVRSWAPGHFTGSALVVNADATQLLVLFHRKSQRWLQPGGHADGDANPAAVARK